MFGKFDAGGRLIIIIHYTVSDLKNTASLQKRKGSTFQFPSGNKLLQLVPYIAATTRNTLT